MLGRPGIAFGGAEFAIFTIVSDANEAVRRYLTWLSSPEQLIDHAAAAELNERLASAEDLIERLRIVAALERATNPSGDELRQAFVRYAREFASAEGIPAAAFLNMGVPEDALIEAGVLRGRRPKRAGSSPRPRVPEATVRTAALARREPFTVSQLKSETSASVMTIRKALQGLVSEGLLEEIGASPDHHRMGRAPQRWAQPSTEAPTPPKRASRRAAKAAETV